MEIYFDGIQCISVGMIAPSFFIYIFFILISLSHVAYCMYIKIYNKFKRSLILYFKYLYFSFSKKKYLYFILRFGFKRGNPLKTEKCAEKNISLMIPNKSLFYHKKKKKKFLIKDSHWGKDFYYSGKTVSQKM